MTEILTPIEADVKFGSLINKRRHGMVVWPTIVEEDGTTWHPRFDSFARYLGYGVEPEPFEVKWKGPHLRDVDWTPQMERYILQLDEDGLSAREIAALVDRRVTKSMINGKLWRLKNKEQTDA